MNTRDSHVSRRRFLQLGAGGLVAVPLAGLGWTTAAQAAELERLSEEDETAKALSYTHDASGVTHDSYQEGSRCSNCLLYSDPEAKEWGPCSVFPKHLVAEGGWCTAWVGRG